MEAAVQPLVSVCIPTYKRPALLAIALRSVIEQGYGALEIVVSDDSPDAEAVAVIEALHAPPHVPIRYRRNEPSLGQSANVDQLFRDALGSYLILLHDDDVLLPGAIATLMAPVLHDPRVRVTFGKQQYIDERGQTLTDETQTRNRLFDGALAGAVANPIEACLLQQFPNDAYLIEAALARDTGYRSTIDTKVAVDVDFGIRLGRVLAPGTMAFVDAFVAGYRRSDDAVSASAAWRRRDHPADAVKLYGVVNALDLPASSEYARRAFLKTVIDALVKGFAQRRQRAMALRLFLSSLYGWRKRLSLKGAYHLTLIAFPTLDRLRRY
jgi:glycosyltransferase involved in cell wall biosynthesis